MKFDDKIWDLEDEPPAMRTDFQSHGPMMPYIQNLEKNASLAESLSGKVEEKEAKDTLNNFSEKCKSLAAKANDDQISQKEVMEFAQMASRVMVEALKSYYKSRK